MSKKLNAIEIPLNTNLEAIAVTVLFASKIHICNIYLPNSHTLNLAYLESLINQLPTPFILMGDFN